MCVCVYVYERECGLPEVSVLAFHGHTGTIWTWAGGENRRRKKEEKTEKDKEGE